jgi:hypothetical protein
MRNPFRRLRALFRRSAMIGTPPSRWPIWRDPAQHARDFAERYAEPLEYAVSQRMTELRIPEDRIGYADSELGGRWRVFNPPQGKGGEVMVDGIGIDSGVLNPDLLKSSRPRTRIDASRPNK